jgi:hypothetical protein
LPSGSKSELSLNRIGRGVNTPRVSVLMAVRDGERFLRESLASVFAQSEADLELVVVDDGSTDGSAAILEAQDDPRLVRLANPKPLGLAQALNRALGVARGELVARQDADDVSHPERLERQLRFLRERPELGVLGTWLERIDAAGRPAGALRAPRSHARIAWSLALGGNPLAHPSVMARRELLERAGGYDARLRVAQDHELWTRLLPRARFANLPEALVRYREHAASLTRTAPAEQLAARLRASARLAAELVGEEVPEALLLDLRRWERPRDARHLRARAPQAMRLLLLLYAGLVERRILSPEDQRELREDLRARLAAASRLA